VAQLLGRVLQPGYAIVLEEGLGTKSHMYTILSYCFHGGGLGTSNISSSDSKHGMEIPGDN